MNYQKKLIFIMGIIFIFSILISGCDFVAPATSDYDSYTVSYIKVLPSSTNMQINASKLLKVKAYDSEGISIPVDPSEVSWVVSYECLACGVVWKLNPKSGSISTYFTPERIGRYYVYAEYKGIFASCRVDVE
ncbi:hypothetical protein CVT91_10890 [Candidatus Atribacteria bacterium HGW-Atribacteria-1]|nr:MAG: hypothetical protein CVT91_10890 [Candidatus Atribacteria bacterium HGW-Atribacteria-1]